MKGILLLAVVLSKTSKQLNELKSKTKGFKVFYSGGSDDEYDITFDELKRMKTEHSLHCNDREFILVNNSTGKTVFAGDNVNDLLKYIGNHLNESLNEGRSMRKQVHCKCKECGCARCEEDLIFMMEDQRLPFTEEKISDKIKIRHFNPNYPDHLFKWHYDEEDRVIEALNPNDWQFQFDNELPIYLPIGNRVFIETGIYHRLIKGTTMLSVRILT